MQEEKIIQISNPLYPKLLKEIADPPQKLYLRGKLNPGEPCFAIVGTRVCSNYGKEVALQIAGELADAGLTIVSGLAPGIDTWAHKGALERKKRTIAVLGTGLDQKSIYPKENLRLAEKIIETGGALISEYEPGTTGSKFTFPKRNRIISGMSLGVLVVEAKERSGSLITAQYALKQKRKLFAIPGSIFSVTSRGTHFAIQKFGAKLVQSASDILQELNLPCLKSDVKQVIDDQEQKEERVILEVLKEGSLYIEEIIEKTGLSSSKVASALVVLEIAGKVKNLGGNTYAISNR